jgi:hypothetical protein
MSELMKRTMQNIKIASEVPNFASASASGSASKLHPCTWVVAGGR